MRTAIIYTVFYQVNVQNNVSFIGVNTSGTILVSLRTAIIYTLLGVRNVTPELLHGNDMLFTNYKIPSTYRNQNMINHKSRICTCSEAPQIKSIILRTTKTKFNNKKEIENI